MVSTPPVGLKAKGPQLSLIIEGCWESCKWRFFSKDLGPNAELR